MWNNYGDPARYHGLMPTVNYGPEEKTDEQFHFHYFCNLKTKYNSPQEINQLFDYSISIFGQMEFI